MTHGTRFLALLGLSLIILTAPGGARAQEPVGGDGAAPEVVLGTSFTYQGRLTNAGSPVSGTCLIQFRLYDAAGTGTPPTGGTRIGPPLEFPVPITNGLFTATLDFGAGVFNGEARWLDIWVRCPATTGTWTGLSPRQPLTAAPYALYAPQAGSANSMAWSGLTGVPAGLADGDDNTTYSAGFGMALTGTSFSVVTSTVQSRVTGTCAPGSSIRAITADGTVTCQADTGALYSAGAGLVLTGTQFSLSPTYQLPQGCANAQIAEWNNGAWICGTDDTGGGSSAWSLTGNSSTGAGNYLGTTDNMTLTLSVSGTTAYRLVPTESTANLIGGWMGNEVTPGVVGATIAGGGLADYPNRVTDHFGTVGGGRSNQAGDGDSTLNNARWATVAGGAFNVASGAWSTVSGGITNTAWGTWSAIGGGVRNTNLGLGAAVPGGMDNRAIGATSFAAGYQAQANHDGAFVWGDAVSATVASSAPNQFVVRANGGFYFITATTDFSPTLNANVFLSTTTGANLTAGGAWTNSSDRSAKANFQAVDEQALLARLAGLPIQTWSYRAEDTAIRHIGPTAQDFHAAFNVGADDRHITTIDADGVALAAIQGLYQLVQAQEAEIASLEARLVALEQQRGPAPAPNVSPVWLVAGGLALLNLGVLIGRRCLRPGQQP